MSFVVGSGPPQAPEVPWPHLCSSQQKMGIAVLSASPLHKSPAWSQHVAHNHWVIRSPLFHFSQIRSCLPPVHWAGPAIMSLLKSERGSLAPSCGKSACGRALPTRPKETTHICISFGAETTALLMHQLITRNICVEDNHSIGRSYIFCLSDSDTQDPWAAPPPAVACWSLGSCQAIFSWKNKSQGGSCVLDLTPFSTTLSFYVTRNSRTPLRGSAMVTKSVNASSASPNSWARCYV